MEQAKFADAKDSGSESSIDMIDEAPLPFATRLNLFVDRYSTGGNQSYPHLTTRFCDDEVALVAALSLLALGC